MVNYKEMSLSCTHITSENVIKINDTYTLVILLTRTSYCTIKRILSRNCQQRIPDDLAINQHKLVLTLMGKYHRNLFWKNTSIGYINQHK